MGYNHHNAVDPVTGFLMSGPNGRPIVFCNPGYHNYGQTPAFARYLQWGFCSDPPTADPNWSACTKTTISDWIDTSESVRPVPARPSHEMTEATVIFYGRLAYFDVFKRQRYSGFIYRWRIDGTHERLGDKYPKYAEWA